MSTRQLRAAPGYQEYEGVRYGVAGHTGRVSVQVFLLTGDPLVARLQKAGYRLTPQQEPE